MNGTTVLPGGTAPPNPPAVFFPGAGSFGGEFRLLMAELRPAAWLVRYPGRYGKDFGTPAGSFHAVVRSCAEQIASRAPEGPLLFGHSFGAYVAYATALALQEAGIVAGGLVAVGACAPGRLEVPEQAAATPADAARYLASVDPGALADAPSDDWREVVAATAAHDLRLLRQFVTASSDTASFGIASSVSLRCPVLAVRGDADPLTSDDGIGEWKHYTDGAFSWLVFPGGHSDVLRSPACTSLIREIRNGWP